MNPDINTENLKLLFGIKVKAYRNQIKLSLQALSKRTGIAVSYLSEIESGKKYPKPEKLIRLAKGLGVSYDALVSLQTDKSLHPFVDLINSDLIQQFPFHLFGIAASDIIGLFKNNPDHAHAFLQTFLQITRAYDLSLDNFLFAALRTYLKQHKNYFPDLETSAGEFANHHGIVHKTIGYDVLKSLLEKEYGYRIDESILVSHSNLSQFRSVLLNEKHLAVNSQLLPSQKAFILARELGFIWCKATERPVTSSWLQVESFDQLINNFKASYFGGALLLNQDQLTVDLKHLFAQPIWQNASFSSLLEQYQVTPEMLLYRISQILPGVLGIDQIFYFRFTHTSDLKRVKLTKELNMTQTLLTYGLGVNEHYCRRMIPLQFLNQLRHDRSGIITGLQTIEFVNSKNRFLLLSMARPLSLSDQRGSAMAIGIKLDKTSLPHIHFIDDPDIPFTQVSETCERCALTNCVERVVSASFIKRSNRIEKRKAALNQLIETS